MYGKGMEAANKLGKLRTLIPVRRGENKQSKQQ